MNLRFLTLLLTLIPLSTSSHAADTSLTANKIISGDEIALNDGRTLRLVGIKAASPDAKTFLESTILNHPLILQDASEDRYGRLAATVTVQGQNQSVEAALLHAGLAFMYPATGDEDHLDALREQEQSARKAKRGIWATSHDTKTTDAATMEGKYAFIIGTVASAVRVKTKLSLTFGTETHRDFVIAIAPHNLRAFKRQGLDPLSWQGQKVRVRGWVTKDKEAVPTITVTDPHQVELLP